MRTSDEELLIGRCDPEVEAVQGWRRITDGSMTGRENVFNFDRLQVIGSRRTCPAGIGSNERRS